jgi:D-beta-D-heptose 7-phosphate kinase/D-beta-D-heptose 1-phosphate adenosyltransferase
VAGIRDREQAEDPLKDGPLLQAADRLSDLWQTEHLMITLGPQGMLLKEKSGEVRHVTTRAREVFDVSGAGDTVIATTMLALAAGATFFEAADLANVAAGIVVAKLGTATVTPDEILAELEEE